MKKIGVVKYERVRSACLLRVAPACVSRQPSPGFDFSRNAKSCVRSAAAMAPAAAEMLASLDLPILIITAVVLFVILAFLGTGRRFLVIGWRTARPWMVRLGILVWMLLRLSPWDPPQTLLQVLEDFLAVAHERMVQGLVVNGKNNINSADTNNEPQYHAILPVLQWLWTTTEDVMAMILFLGMSRIVYCLWHYSMHEWWWELLAAADSGWWWWWMNQNDDDNDDENHYNATRLPEQGRPMADILQELHQQSQPQQQQSSNIDTTKLSGVVYHHPHHPTYATALRTLAATPNRNTNNNDNDHEPASPQSLAQFCGGPFAWTNPEHPGVWPKLDQCQAELIAMVGHVVLPSSPSPSKQQQPPEFFGSVLNTTEATISVLRAYRRVYGQGMPYPEVICHPYVHPAVVQACEVLGMRRRVVTDWSKNHLARAVTAQTIAIVASVPSYPHGFVDPIRAIAKIAAAYRIGLHVELGAGLLGPFLREEATTHDNKQKQQKQQYAEFDCPGVTSVSVDLGTYGGAPPGLTVVLYRQAALRRGQYHCSNTTTCMPIASAALPGARSGGLIVAAWATLQSMGRQRYRRQARILADACRNLGEGIDRMRGVKLAWTTPPPIVCLTVSESDGWWQQVHLEEEDDDDDFERACLARLVHGLREAGWSLQVLLKPIPCMQLWVTLAVAPKVDSFLRDLRLCLEQQQQHPAVRRHSGSSPIPPLVPTVLGAHPTPSPKVDDLHTYVDHTLSGAPATS